VRGDEQCESGLLRAVHLSRHEWPGEGGVVSWDSDRLSKVKNEALTRCGESRWGRLARGRRRSCVSPNQARVMSATSKGVCGVMSSKPKGKALTKCVI
jgi:hypothetical protein